MAKDEKDYAGQPPEKAQIPAQPPEKALEKLSGQSPEKALEELSTQPPEEAPAQVPSARASEETMRDADMQLSVVNDDLSKRPSRRSKRKQFEALAAANPEAERVFGRKVPLMVKVIIVVVLVAVFLISFAVGTYALNPLEVIEGTFRHFFDPASIEAATAAGDNTLLGIDKTLFGIRFPRIIVCMLVGAALSVAGASYQGMFKNPLTSPDLLGAAAGASLGACIALLLDLAGGYVQLFAFVGGMLAVLFTVSLNGLVKYDALLGLVLGGIMVSTLFESGTSMVKLLADSDDKLPEITYWLMGSFASVQDNDLIVCIIPMLVGFVIILSQGWRLNVMSFGDEEARSLGISTRSTRYIVIFAATLLTSTSVAVSGIIGWIGLVIPHLARAIVGPNYRVLLPVSMIIGAAYLLVIDDICRVVFTPELPIGILTAVVGVPFFLFIFRRNMKGWS